MRIAVLGGTGDMGYGLSLRLAMAGEEVVIGSRVAEKAQEAADKAKSATNCEQITGAENRAAAESAELVIIAVPTSGHRALITSLRDVLSKKNILDVTVPIGFKPLRYAPPAEGSNALETLAVLGEETYIACGFHTVSASLLEDLSSQLSGDVLICGNNDALKETLIALSKKMGFTAYNAGSLYLSSSLEGLTPMLIGLNKRYNSNHTGIGIVGVGL